MATKTLPPSASKKRTTSRTPKTTARDVKELAALGNNEFDAVVTQEQIQGYERSQDEMWGTKRRVAMIALSRSKKQLIKGFGDGVETLIEMIDHINEWRDHMKGQIEMAEQATARLLIVSSAILYGNESVTV